MMSDRDEGARPGRRRFLRLIGMAGLWSPLVARPLALAAQAGGSGAPVAPKPTADAAASSPTAPDSAASEKKISSEAQALAEVVKLRHGEHLSEEELRHIAGDLDDRLESGRKLARLKLTNGDEPAFEFRA